MTQEPPSPFDAALKFDAEPLYAGTMFRDMGLSNTVAPEISQSLAALLINIDACRHWLSADPPNIQQVRAAMERMTSNANALTGPGSSTPPTRVANLNNKLRFCARSRGQFPTQEAAIKLLFPVLLASAGTQGSARTGRRHDPKWTDIRTYFAILLRDRFIDA